MKVNTNHFLFFFICFCFISMALPMLLGLGDGNLFIRDFFAKRIMTLFSFPFFLWVTFVAFKKNKVYLSKNITTYLILYLVVLIISLFKMNSITLIVTDAFIGLLPFFFYLLIFKTDFKIASYKNYFKTYLFIAVILVLLEVKLQFSYFSLISLIYILFFIEWKIKNIPLFLLLPFLAIETFIGKSALLMFLFIIFYLFIFDKQIISKSKKIFFVTFPLVLIVLFLIIFWEQVQQSGSYKNFLYFLRNADFTNFTFKDLSTGHRLFEAEVVLTNFFDGNFISKLFGNGFGSTIDLSQTKDMAVLNANKNTNAVRNIHMGPFAVLSRFGLIGVFVYFTFTYKILSICFKTLKKQTHFSVTLGSFYVIIIIFDSFISFPHMMSNFLFWFITFVLIKENKNTK